MEVGDQEGLTAEVDEEPAARRLQDGSVVEGFRRLAVLRQLREGRHDTALHGHGHGYHAVAETVDDLDGVELVGKERLSLVSGA